MSTSRIVLNLSETNSPEETSRRTMQELIDLVRQLNDLQIPIVVGPGENLPLGITQGQPVIDWSSGTSVWKVWNGIALV